MRKCQYNKDYNCHQSFIKECPHPNLTICLLDQINNDRKRLMELTDTIDRGHTKLSRKWKDSSFYYKSRVKALEAYISERGLDLPTVEELRKGGSDA